MNWIYALLFLAGFATLWRVYYGIRQMKEKREKDWDERLIDRLRKSGSDPFQPHEVDFFMAMPSEAAGQAVAAILEAEGYRVDVKRRPTIRPISPSVCTPPSRCGCRCPECRN